MRVLLSVLVSLLLAACVSTGASMPTLPVASAALLSGDRLDGPLPAASDDGRWLRLDDDMREFAAEFRRFRPQAYQLQRLLARLLDPGGGGFSYQPEATLAAREAFQQQRGNCLSFAGLLVALSREAGFEAQFQRVELPPEWDLRGDTVVAALHINTLISIPGQSALEVEWGGRMAQPWHRREVLSDARALAEFHNNLGVEALIAGRVPRAFAELRRALQLAPNTAHLWVNLAALYRSLGDEDAAESAWLQALAHNPDELPALSGLQRLYQQQGRSELAAQLQARVQRYRDSNPYYHYSQARRAFEHGDYDAARVAIERAQALAEDARFIALEAKIAQSASANF